MLKVSMALGFMENNKNSLVKSGYHFILTVLCLLFAATAAEANKYLTVDALPSDSQFYRCNTQSDLERNEKKPLPSRIVIISHSLQKIWIYQRGNRVIDYVTSKFSITGDFVLFEGKTSETALLNLIRNLLQQARPVSH
jgi:hypothetical protein